MECVASAENGLKTIHFPLVAIVSMIEFVLFWPMSIAGEARNPVNGPAYLNM
jgi:hypothetical protein